MAKWRQLMEGSPRRFKAGPSSGGPPRVELHAQLEMDNFCCSHGCTSYVLFGKGRVGVLALTRPALSRRSLFYLLSCSSIQSLAGVMRGLVFSYQRHLRISPKFHKAPINYSGPWRRYGLSSGPPLERSPINFQDR